MDVRFAHGSARRDAPPPPRGGRRAPCSDSRSQPAAAGRWTTAVLAGAALALLLVWLVVYLRVSAPINRQLTAAAQARGVPANARALQANWDRVINLRAVLHGLAVCALCVALMI